MALDLLSLDPADDSMSEIERGKTVPGGQEWFDNGVELERENVDAALRAYEHAIAGDPAFLDAHINLGRLLHETRRFAKAERVYLRGDQTLWRRSRAAL